MDEREQQILQRNLSVFLMHDVFRTITEDDILSIRDGIWFYKGNQLSEGMVKKLAKEAKILKQMKLFDVLINEIVYHAKDAQDKSKTEADLISARLLAYFADVVKSKINKISEMQQV